jgi:hypothetical protein
MTHAHVRRRLSEYLEGDLPPGEESALEAHLRECDPCTAELRALRRAIDLLHSLPAPEPTRDLGAAVLDRLRAGEGAPARWSPAAWFGGASPLGWLVPAAAALGIGVLSWFPDGAGQTPVAEMAQAIPTSLPPMASCLDRPRSADPTRDECAGWYAWYLELAQRDAPGFAHEMDHLPASLRDPWLRRLSDFAARSGEAGWVGQQFRSSHEPGATRIARSFERGGGRLVRQVGYQR